MIPQTEISYDMTSGESLLVLRAGNTHSMVYLQVWNKMSEVTQCLQLRVYLIISQM